MTTIRDVAREAGVSVSTVSRVISGRPEVADATRQRILAAIDALNFRPSAVARSLIQNKTRAIGVIVSDISNPFYPELMKGIEEHAADRGYTIILTNSDDELDKHARALAVLRERRVDGLILASIRRDDPSISALVANSEPCVLANRGLPGRRLSEVVLDNVAGAAIATQHLIDAGHSRLVYLGGPDYAQNSLDRRRGFKRAAKAAALPEENARTYKLEFLRPSTRERVRVKLEEIVTQTQKPFGAVAVNDELGVQVLEVVHSLGLEVPEDVAVLGFDNSQLACSPFIGLTTVSQEPHSMGTEAARLLIDRLEGRVEKWPVRLVFRPQLIVRASTSSEYTPLGRLAATPSAL
jgi:LacI family transcriptional regulator